MNGKLEHNPGPWRFVGPNYNVMNKRGQKHEIIAGDGAHVCQVYANNIRVIANAELIASAPEMKDTIREQAEEIEKLREALETIQRGTVQDGWILVAPQFVGAALGSKS